MTIGGRREPTPVFRRPLPVAVGPSDVRDSLPVTVTDAGRRRRGRGLRGTDRGTTAGDGPQQSAARSVPTFPFQEVVRRPGPADPGTDLGDRGDPGALWLHHLIESGQLGMRLAAGHHHRSVVLSTPERLDRYPVQPHGLLRHVDTPCGAEPGIDIRLCLPAQVVSTVGLGKLELPDSAQPDLGFRVRGWWTSRIRRMGKERRQLK